MATNLPKYNPTLLERPSSVKEAVSLLSKWGSRARVVAGNTTIYELANQGGLMDVETLIDISELRLNYVAEDDNRALRIGAMTTFSEMGSSEILERKSSYALKETAMKLTPPQIRNMGTLGGSACSGIPFYDMPVALLAVDANFEVASPNGERTIKAQDFFIDYFMTALSPEDLLVEVRIPEKVNTGSSFVKLGRTSIDFALANASVMITLDEKSMHVLDARIALGAVSSTPIRARASEEFLIGNDISEETLTKTASLAADFEPSPSLHGTSEYKKKIIPIVAREALFSAAGRAQEAARKS